MLDGYKDEKRDFVEDEEVNENSDNEKDKDTRENKNDRDDENDENDENYNDKKNDRDYEEVEENKENKEVKKDNENRENEENIEDRNDKKEKDDEEISDLDEHRDFEVENEDEKHQKKDNFESEWDKEGDFDFLYNNGFNKPVEIEENFEQNPENEDENDFRIDEDLEIEPDLDNSSENKKLEDGKEEEEENEPDFDELFENKFDVDQDIREDSDDQDANVEEEEEGEESEPDFDELFENKFDVDQEIREESNDLSATVEEKEGEDGEEGEESEPDFDEIFEDNDWLTTKLNEELQEIPELLHNDVQEQLNQTEKNFDHLYNEDNYIDLGDNEAISLKNSNIGDEKDINEEQQIVYFNHLFGDDFGLSSNSDLVNQQDFNDTYYKNFAEFQEMDNFLTKTINSLDNNKENEIDFKNSEENFKDFEKIFTKSIENAQFFKCNPARINSESLDILKNQFHDINNGDINSPLFELRDGKIFFYPGYMRCSNLHVKYLKPNAIKENLHKDLKNKKYYLPFSPDSIPKKEGEKIPKVLLDIVKTTSDLHKMWQIQEPALSNIENHEKWFYSKPNHNVIEKYLYNKFPQIVAIETPVWSEPLQLTGHVDFLLFDDKTLYVMDYKPEAADGKEHKFINTIPQVSMYGKLIKKFVPDDIDVKCVSFSKDSGWIYDPNKIEEVLPALIKNYMKKPEFFEKLPWIPLANDKPAPFETMAQTRINEYFNSILDNKSQQPYRKKFRKVLHNLQNSDKIPQEDIKFLGKALKKNFNLTKEDVSEYITQYKKNFKSKELYKEFLNNIGKGMLCPECSQNYINSKYATLNKDSLPRIFYAYKKYVRAIINNINIDRMNLKPYLREVFDIASKNSTEQLKRLNIIWKNTDKGGSHVPIEDFSNISDYIFDKMEKGEDLTDIFLKVKNISTQDSLEGRIIYFKDRIRKFFNQDRERALNLYDIPISPKKISVSIDKDGNVELYKYKNYLPNVKEIEGLSSRKFFIKNLEENKSPKEIVEYLKQNIPKNDFVPTFDNFIHRFREWAKDNRAYLFKHFNIPKDVDYQIKQNKDFTIPVEIRINDFCTKRLKQGVPLENFAKTALNQVPEERRKVKWRQICNAINIFAKNNPIIFHDKYGIQVNEKFSAADYLSTHLDNSFDKQKRTFKTPTKYSIEGLPLKKFIQDELDHFPKQDIADLFNKILKIYPKNQLEIRTTIGRCAKTWINDNPTHSDCKKVENSLEKFQSSFKTSNTKMQLLKDILENKEIEQCKQNYFKNTLIEKGTSNVDEHTLITTISRMKRIIKHRTTHPSATFDDLKLISKKTLSKSALNTILSTPIQDLNKLKIIENKKNTKEITKDITTLPKMKTDLPKSEQILMQHYIQEKYVNTGMKEQTITETKRGILQFYDFLRKNSPKIQEISKISYNQYQQYDKFLKEDLKLTKKAYTNYSSQIRRYLNYYNPDFSKRHSESQQKQKQPALQNDRKLIEKFINEKFVLPGKSKNSMSKANSALKNYCEFIKKQQPDLKSIENAKNSQINEFKTYLMKDKKYSSETIRKQKQIVQNFLQFNNLLEFQNKITNIKLHIAQQIQKHTDLSSMMTNILKQTPDAQKQTKITTCKRYIHNTFKKFPEIAKNIYEFENSPNTVIRIDITGKVSIYIR